MLLLKESTIANLSTKEKIKYYNSLREYCLSLNKNGNISLGQKLFSKLCPSLRNYDLEIYGEENIPSNGAFIVCNHSNSHDTFTACEVFTKLDLPVSVFAASDDLNFLSNNVFKMMDCTLIDRYNKESCTNGLMELTSKVLNYGNGLIFGEATWNLHPYKPMQNLKIGAARASAIASKPIIPTIFEYYEVPNICSKEKELYYKCIIKFGKPIMINKDYDLSSQIFEVQKIMANMRLELWEKIYKEKLDIPKNADKKVYVNHTYLKKFGGIGFNYDSKEEEKFLYFREGEKRINEYHFDNNGLFVPGITRKEDKEKVLKLSK